MIAPHEGAPAWKLFSSAVGEHVLIVPHSRIFDVPPELSGDHDALGALVREAPGEVTMDAVPEPAPQSLSLNVSKACNLGCGYCYAGQGAFGGKQANVMSWETAKSAVDQLLRVVDHAAPITIGFMGGEPFVNRALIHEVVRYATAAARERCPTARLGFSVTTNGTLLTEEDVALLRAHRFAVTVSVDGGRALQDAQRPLLRRSSFDALKSATAPLLREPGLARIAARATVSPSNVDFDLARRFDDILALGFREVGFAPVRAAFSPSDWARYLDSSGTLARRELAGALAGEPIRFANFAIALKQLHRGASMPYPCGAGGGYFSVGADGVWYACHRAIGDDAYALGDNLGLDDEKRGAFLRERHVHAQEACRTCWARYLCSGGCHQEATSRSDSSCGFVRGWLELCLASYCELSTARPRWFSGEGSP